MIIAAPRIQLQLPDRLRPAAPRAPRRTPVVAIGTGLRAVVIAPGHARRPDDGGCSRASQPLANSQSRRTVRGEISSMRHCRVLRRIPTAVVALRVIRGLQGTIDFPACNNMRLTWRLHRESSVWWSSGNRCQTGEMSQIPSRSAAGDLCTSRLSTTSRTIRRHERVRGRLRGRFIRTPLAMRDS